MGCKGCDDRAKTLADVEARASTAPRMAMVSMSVAAQRPVQRMTLDDIDDAMSLLAKRQSELYAAFLHELAMRDANGDEVRESNIMAARESERAAEKREQLEMLFGEDY